MIVYFDESDITSTVIRRFRVRIPGGFLSPVNPSTRWPNGKAPDYGALFAAGDGSLARILYFDEVNCVSWSFIIIHLILFKRCTQSTYKVQALLKLDLTGVICCSLSHPYHTTTFHSNNWYRTTINNPKQYYLHV